MSEIVYWWSDYARLCAIHKNDQTPKWTHIHTANPKRMARQYIGCRIIHMIYISTTKNKIMITMMLLFCWLNIFSGCVWLSWKSSFGLICKFPFWWLMMTDWLPQSIRMAGWAFCSARKLAQPKIGCLSVSERLPQSCGLAGWACRPVGKCPPDCFGAASPLLDYYTLCSPGEKQQEETYG